MQDRDEAEAVFTFVEAYMCWRSWKASEDDGASLIRFILGHIGIHRAAEPERDRAPHLRVVK